MYLSLQIINYDSTQFGVTTIVKSASQTFFYFVYFCVGLALRILFASLHKLTSYFRAKFRIIFRLEACVSEDKMKSRVNAVTVVLGLIDYFSDAYTVYNAN